eukprot:1643024-Pleurochrysis_carterae.AAC.1
MKLLNFSARASQARLFQEADRDGSGKVASRKCGWLLDQSGCRECSNMSGWLAEEEGAPARPRLYSRPLVQLG